MADKHSVISSRTTFYCTISLFIVLVANLLITTLISLFPLFNDDYKNISYSSFRISEWLINYEGGFVRRGLIGEVLYLAFNIHSYDVKLIILLINAGFFVWLTYIVIKVCNGLNMSVIPSLVVFCGAMITFPEYRRDFLVLTLCFYIFLLFTRHLSNGKRTIPFSFIILTSLCILIHEPTFFFTVPLLAIILWFSGDYNLSSPKKTLQLIKVFSVPIITMGLVCIMKGTGNISYDIWTSWTPLFRTYPESNSLPCIGEGVAFLERKFPSTAGFHLELNYCIWGYSLTLCLQRIFSVIITLFATYFLLTYNPYINLKNRTVIINKRTGIGLILLIQYFSMIPMFTILSCDFGRTILYCVISSTIAYYFIKRNNIQIHTPRILSKYPALFFYNSQHISHNVLWIYLLTILLYPIRAFGGIVFPDDCYINKLIHFIYTLNL